MAMIRFPYVLTDQIPRPRLKSPASRLFTQPFIQTPIKKIIKAPRHRPLWGGLTGEFPTQRAIDAENVSIWWRHHVVFGVDSLVLGPVVCEIAPASGDCITSATKRGCKPLTQWHRSFQLKAVLPLAIRLATASDRSSNTGPGVGSLKYMGKCTSIEPQ